MNEPISEHADGNTSDFIWSGYRVAVDLVSLDGELERLAFQIVPDELADFLNGYLGEGTLLGKTILGHRIGDRIPYQGGDIVEVRIVGAERVDTLPDEGVAERRLESLRKALKQTELANMIAFAASFSSKWGDYDPQSLSDEWEKNEL